MIQDIEPRIDIAFRGDVTPEAGDKVFTFFDGRLYDVTEESDIADNVMYLFSIGKKQYFGGVPEKAPSGGNAMDLRQMRRERTETDAELMAAFTAYHILKWAADNRFCGRCGGKTVLSGNERALVCEECGNTIYPRINPAVIIGVIRDDSLLLVRSNTGYGKDHPVLVSGFAEIGETLEDTVKREVMEETGLVVGDVRYFASQPWGMAEDLLVGFFCRCVSDKEPEPDRSELRSASFVKREDIKTDGSELSLTNAMIKAFADGYCLE